MRTVLAVSFLLAVAAPCLAEPHTVTVNPSADTFVREAQPDSNFGKAGALSVAGPDAFSYVLPTQHVGRFDSFIRFPAASASAALDSQFGSRRWVVTSVVLNLTEQTKPNNPIFALGPGTFEVRWVQQDSWTEGTGTPSLPTTDGLAWNGKPLVLGADDASLGTFANVGAGPADNIPISCTLGLPAALVNDIRDGAQLTLFLTPASSAIGFTFNSVNVTGTRVPPSISVTADRVDGDVNLDCKVNILDLIFIRNRINGDVASGDNWQADANGDGLINILDLIYVRNRLNAACTGL